MTRRSENDIQLVKYLRQASMVSVGISLAGYIALLSLLWGTWDGISLAAFVIGSVAGVVVGNRRLIDPLRFVPYVRPGFVITVRDAMMDRLQPDWRRYPKALSWVGAILGSIGVVAAIYLRPLGAASVPAGLKVIRAVFAGFAPNAILCSGVFYLYALANWRARGDGLSQGGAEGGT